MLCINFVIINFEIINFVTEPLKISTSIGREIKEKRKQIIIVGGTWRGKSRCRGEGRDRAVRLDVDLYR
jgi:hypothetical protein